MPLPKLATSSSRITRGTWLLLAASAVIVIALKLITADRPIARDVMLYTVIGHEMMEGRELYTDLFEHKPPLFLALFGIANTIVGYGQPAITFLGIACSLATLAGVFYSAKQMGRTNSAGIFGAFSWALLSNDVNMYAHQPMPECFINACMIWSFGLFLTLHSRKIQLIKCLTIGICLMMASQVKQPVVIIAAGWAVVHLATRINEPRERLRRLGQLAIIGSVGAVSWLGLFVYFTAVGRYQIFYDSIFTYNRHYAGFPDSPTGIIYGMKIIWWNLQNGLRLHRLFPAFLWMTAPLFIASMTAIVPGLLRGNRRNWLMWGSYLAMTFLLVTLPGRGYNHYYMVYLPVFITGVAGCLSIINERLRPSPKIKALVAVVVVSICTLAFNCIYQLVSSTTVWERVGYAAHFQTVSRLSEYIDKALLPDETLYVWDYQPAFYVLPHRRPPVGVFYNQHALAGPMANELTSRVLDMMKNAPAEVYIIDDANRPLMNDLSKEAHPVYDWIRRNAREVDVPDSAPYGIYVLNDGPLAKRIEAGQVKWNYAK